MKQKKIIEIDGIKITKANKIKHGAEAKIYEGYLNQNEQKKVALKKHKEKFTNEQILLLKILKEQINDHIIEIIAFGQTQKGKCYIVMELGNQIDLMNLANKQQTCLEMAKSIQILHKYGYFHRDLKPENFVISQKGKIKLIDFGIAKKMDDNLFMSFNGTYDYIAPEILISKEYDASVDIWSLGVIFFEVLVGKQFFRLLNLDRIQDYIIISQIQINRIIKAQKNLQNKEVEILNKMIVQRLNIQTDCSLNKSIQRIKINDLVDELKNMYNLDISISSLIVENKFLNWEIISEFNDSSVSINQSLCIQNSNKSQIEDIIPKLPELLINDQVNDIPKSASLSMWINKEEINNHQWYGEYGKNLNKKGKWIAIWKGEQLQNAGGVYDGIMKERKRGYGRNSFIIFEVKHKSMKLANILILRGLEYGMYFYKDQEIAQGMYNEFGQKNGKWIELSERFQDKCQIIYDGVYENGNKVGKWDTMYRQRNKFQLISGGFYEVKKGNNNSIKIGSWTELSNVESSSLVTYNGSYNNGLKIGNWQIFWNQNGDNEKIGGGSYESKEYNNKLAKSQKIGNWIKLIDIYKKDRQITFLGQYKNGMKVNKWDTIFRQNQQNEIIDGGSYLENSINCEDSIKIGRWIELSDNLKMDSQIIQVDSYKNKNKVGKRDIFYRKNDKFDWIGGGSYDYQGESNGENKIGKWIEPSEFFSKKLVYAKQPIMVSLEEEKEVESGILCIEGKMNLNGCTGVGVYDNQLKQGEWVKLNEGFNWSNKTITSGKYQNGIKFNVVLKKEWIGGGCFEITKGDDNVFFKLRMEGGLNQVIDLKVISFNQVIFKGDYKYCKTVVDCI